MLASALTPSILIFRIIGSYAYGRDLLGQVYALHELAVALLEWAAKVDLVDIVAKIGFLVDETDKPVFDL